MISRQQAEEAYEAAKQLIREMPSYKSFLSVRENPYPFGTILSAKESWMPWRAMVIAQEPGAKYTHVLFLNPTVTLGTIPDKEIFGGSWEVEDT